MMLAPSPESSLLEYGSMGGLRLACFRCLPPPAPLGLARRNLGIPAGPRLGRCCSFPALQSFSLCCSIPPAVRQTYPQSPQVLESASSSVQCPLWFVIDFDIDWPMVMERYEWKY